MNKKSNDLKARQDYFAQIFAQAYAKYGTSTYRLAGDGWDAPWKTVIVTLMSAQTRDEVTIPVAERLFAKYPTLPSLARAQPNDVLTIIRSLNYSPTKAYHAVQCAEMLLNKYDGKVPQDIDELVTLPGVGRKTANLVIAECFGQDGICVDTHVHRIANVFGFVKTKTPAQTEIELQKVAPKNQWSKINRIFVLWGKDVKGYDKEAFIHSLREK